MSPTNRSGARQTARRPFRIVVVAHGSLAHSLVETAEGIHGPIEGVTALGLDPAESPEALAARLAAALDEDRRPALVLTDLRGGTPHNVATRLARPGRVECMAGVNLALLLESIDTVDELDAPVLARLAAAAREGIALLEPARAAASPQAWD